MRSIRQWGKSELRFSVDDKSGDECPHSDDGEDHDGQRDVSCLRAIRGTPEAAHNANCKDE